MSCTVAVSNSPVFSPSSSHTASPLFRKASFPPLFSRISSPSSHLPPCSSPSSHSLASAGFRSNCSDDALSTSNLVSNSSSSSPTTTTTAAILKRKRPARLNIPAMDLGFGGSSASTPRPVVVEDKVVEAERDGYYSVCCKRGRRAAMEDRYSAALELGGNPKQAFYGIFDGHGGSKAAQFSSENLNINITDEFVARRVTHNDDDNIIKEAVKQAYLKTDTDFLKEQENHGGTCCVTAIIKDRNLIVSNAGDCRAVMSRDGVAVPLTTDHRPSREDEKQRIEATGGYVDCYRGVWRIQGSLAVSRGIGDRQLKRWVIAEPETEICRIENECEFLILASDGLWDKVENQEAVDFVRPLVRMDKGRLLGDACRKLVDVSISRGSIDDVSVMIVMLDRYM